MRLLTADLLDDTVRGSVGECFVKSSLASQFGCLDLSLVRPISIFPSTNPTFQVKSQQLPFSFLVSYFLTYFTATTFLFNLSQLD